MSQVQLARAAGIGKSQLSKYERSRELPKLDSLEKVLVALSITRLDFFLILEVFDRSAAALALPRQGSADNLLFDMLVFTGTRLLPAETQQTLNRLLTDLFAYHGSGFGQVIQAAVASSGAGTPSPEPA